MFNAFNLLSIINKILDPLSDFIKTIGGYLFKILYFLTQCFVWLIDFLQIIFRKLAGVDTYFVKKTSSSQYQKFEGDIILNLITDKRVYSVFIGIVILSIVLLFCTTIVAIIRSEYATEGQQNNKTKILAKSVKGLFSFLLVPVTLLLGLVVGNALLNALDGITSNSSGTTYITTDETTQTVTTQKPTVNLYIIADDRGKDINTQVTGVFQINSTSIGGLIFESSMYNCNRQRIDNTFLGETNEDKYGLRFGGIFVDDNTSSVTDSSVVTAADKIDMFFANGYYVSENKLNYEDLKANPKYKNIVGMWDDGLFTGAPDDMYRFNRYNPRQVYMYYNLNQISWLFLQWVAIVSILPAMISLCFALIRRIFEVIILFLISPPIAALIPLDNGDALKKWRVRTVGVVIEAYSSVVLFNLLFLLLPLIQQIKLFDPELKFLNMVINLLIICCGFGLIKDLSKVIGDFIGSANALDEGNKAGAASLNTVKRAGTAATSILMRPINLAKARHDATKAIKDSQNKKQLGIAQKYAHDTAYKQSFDSNIKNFEAEEISKLSAEDQKDQAKVANAKQIAKQRAEKIAESAASKAVASRTREIKLQQKLHFRTMWKADYDETGDAIRKVNRNGEIGGIRKSEAIKEKLKTDREVEVGEELQDLRDRFRASLFGGDSAANFLSFKEADKADQEGYGTRNLARNIARKNAKQHYDMKRIRSIAKENKLAEAANERVPSLQEQIYARQEAERSKNDKENNIRLAQMVGREVAKQLDARGKGGSSTITTDVTTGSSD